MLRIVNLHIYENVYIHSYSERHILLLLFEWWSLQFEYPLFSVNLFHC